MNAGLRGGRDDAEGARDPGRGSPEEDGGRAPQPEQVRREGDTDAKDRHHKPAHAASLRQRAGSARAVGCSRL